jgi:hypothetical protein
MSLDPSATIVRSADTVATEVDGEIVLIDIEAGKYFGMDSVGSEIWRRLESPVRVDALCAAMVAHFEGDAAVIESETRAFLDKLDASNLLRIS